MSRAVYLSVNQVIAIHDKAIDDYGGTNGVRDRGLLETAIYHPMLTLGLMEMFPDIFSKASTLLKSLSQNQAFVDGNKRTAFISTILFLKINGYVLRTSDAEATQFMFKIASGVVVSIQEIAEWLMTHCGVETQPDASKEAPIYNVKIDWKKDDDYPATIKFMVKAGALEKDEELMFGAGEDKTGLPAIRFFKPRGHEDHLEVLYQDNQEKFYRNDFRLGNIVKTKDNEVLVHFDGSQVNLSIDGKRLDNIILEES